MKYLFLIILPSFALCDCSVGDALSQLRPGAEWSAIGNKVNWIDKSQTKPTDAEISSAIAACNQGTDSRNTLKQQARLDVKNTSLTQAKRLQALLVILDLDK